MSSSTFWLQGDDDSDEDIYSSGSDDEHDEQPQQKQAATSRYTFDSDDEEEAKRVVRSAKEKRFEELQECIKKLRNGLNINDWKKVDDGTFADLALSDTNLFHDLSNIKLV